MNFVNINGDPVSTLASIKPKKRDASGPAEYHKGFRVVGIPPGEYEQAQRENQAAQVVDRKYGGDVRPDLPPYEQWANQFRPKPVRSKPYEVPDAANVCALLAKMPAGIVLRSLKSSG